jgi:hypothetical protein
LGPSQLDSSLLNNIQKLFSERIDLSGTVEPNKGSVVMAIIKICLKVRYFTIQRVQVIFGDVLDLIHISFGLI